MWQVLSAVNSLVPALHRTLAAFATEDLTGPVTAADPDNSRRAYNVHQHGPQNFASQWLPTVFATEISTAIATVDTWKGDAAMHPTEEAVAVLLWV